MRRNRHQRMGARKPSKEELLKRLAASIEEKRDAGQLSPEKAEELKAKLVRR